MGFLSTAKIKAAELVEQAASYLQAKYEQAGQLFTPASPFGQLLIVISNISELIFTYIAHTAEEMNIQTAQNMETIFGLSRLAGHDPYRGGSAYGVIEAKANSGASSAVDGRYITIKNFSRFMIEENGYTYFMNLGTDFLRISLTGNEYTTIPFFEGTIESQTFISNGEALQSFNPSVANMTDHNNVSVTVNGKEWERVESLYDMSADDGDEGGEQFMVKTSVNIGLTVFFGNGSFGKIPPAGSQIVVTYIKTAGAGGNYNASNLNYKFIDNGTDEYGNDVDLNEVLQINTVTPPLLGSNYEDPDFTRYIAPKTSKSFVLATPENYVSYLGRYNQYSYIYAYNTKDDDILEDDNVIYLDVLPKVKSKFTDTQDYFSLPEKEYRLDKTEKAALLQAIEDSGRMLVGSEVVINDMQLKRFAINVVVRYFDTVSKAAIREAIRNKFNKYFININRNDIIPLSDLTALVEGIDGVDTCTVFFITEDNEKAIINGSYEETYKVWDANRLMYVDAVRTTEVTDGVDPALGMDSFGNIVMDHNTLYIPRGGWYDREGNYFTETPEDGSLGPLNIFFTDKVDNNMYNTALQKKLNNLIKNS